MGGPIGPLHPQFERETPQREPVNPAGGVDDRRENLDRTANPREAKIPGIADYENQVGVYGYSQTGMGVWGTSVAGIGVYGQGGAYAGLFEGKVGIEGSLEVSQHVNIAGDVEVRGDIRLVNADCAEDFDMLDATAAEPGTVMVLGEGGALLPSWQAYDQRVAGVISGAGGYQPGIVLDKQARENRRPVALLGKVYCKVDAGYGAIETGDLLTTSPTPGHAMKAADPQQAFGACLGKALGALPTGQGLIPILVTLQ